MLTGKDCHIGSIYGSVSEISVNPAKMSANNSRGSESDIIPDVAVVCKEEETIQPRKYAPEESRRMTKNVIFISLAFMVLFTATGSMSNLQSSLNPEKGLGTYSRACGYATMVLSSMFISTFVIQRYTVKKTLVFAMFGSVFSIAAQFYPRFSTMIPASIISGLFSAPFWSAKCTYLTQVGVEYAELVGEKSGPIITRFFGIFFLIFQTSKIWGNLIASTVLTTDYRNGTAKDISMCGVRFCPADAQDKSIIEKAPMWQVYLLAGIYLAVGFSAVLIAGFFVDSLERYGEKRQTTLKVEYQPVIATLQLMRNPVQILLIPITIWSGLEQGFYSADYYQGFVTCAWGVEYVGYIGMCYGLCDALGAYSFGTIVRHVGRIPVFLLGGAMNLGIIITMFYWQPDPKYSWQFFVIAGVWGVADSIWQTQINALYAIVFPEKKEAGFGNYRLWESAGFIVAFVIADLLCVRTKMHILLGALSAGITGYLLIEFLQHKRSRRRRNSILN